MINGYIGICHESGKYVPADEAADYAADQCGIKLTDKTTDEFRDMFVEWFFSGSWIPDTEDSDGT